MARTKRYTAFLPIFAAVIAAIAVVVPTPAGAEPDTCKQGLVWREARPGDHVCVSPEFRARTIGENNDAYKYWVAGEYGPQTCVSGRVWREAFDGDTVCVTPDIRAENLAANAAAASNTQGNQPQTPQASTIVLEVTGSGEVYSIWSIPFNQVAPDHTKMPFSKSYPLPADEDYVSLTWTSRDDSPKGCRITVDNKVVVEKPLGTKEDCVFTR